MIENQGVMVQNVNGRQQQLGWAAEYDGHDATIQIAKQDPQGPLVQYNMHLTREDLQRLVSAPHQQPPTQTSLQKRLENEFFGPHSPSQTTTKKRRRRKRRKTVVRRRKTRVRVRTPDIIESPKPNEVFLERR